MELASAQAKYVPALFMCLAPLPHCLQPQEGRILDEASPALAEARAARRQNRAELRAEMDRWARQLHAQGVSERAQVSHSQVCTLHTELTAGRHCCEGPDC